MLSPAMFPCRDQEKGVGTASAPLVLSDDDDMSKPGTSAAKSRAMPLRPNPPSVPATVRPVHSASELEIVAFLRRAKQNMEDANAERVKWLLKDARALVIENAALAAPFKDKVSPFAKMGSITAGSEKSLNSILMETFVSPRYLLNLPPSRLLPNYHHHRSPLPIHSLCPPNLLPPLPCLYSGTQVANLV